MASSKVEFTLSTGVSFQGTVDFFLRNIQGSGDPVRISKSSEMQFSGTMSCILDLVRADGYAARFKVEQKVGDANLDTSLALTTYIYVTATEKLENEQWKDKSLSETLLSLYGPRGKNLIRTVGKCMGWSSFAGGEEVQSEPERS